MARSKKLCQPPSPIVAPIYEESSPEGLSHKISLLSKVQCPMSSVQSRELSSKDS